ncbi:MAG: CDP-diacylglycerol--glycerol-3-phosphate 3-phosphatidyltransferase [Christensenellales bacterium]|jgi:cardiolipin synthase
MQKEKARIWNLPNALTMLRLLLIPVFIILMCQDHMMPALAVFVFASFTDILDGWIARKYNLITDFGKLFDPLADKLMVMSVMTLLVIKGIVPLVAIIILISKELLMLIGSYLLMRKNVIVYSFAIGKIAQFITVAGLILCFFHKEFAARGIPVHLIVLWIGVGLAVVSMFYYGFTNGPKLFITHNNTTDEDLEG